MFNVSILLIKKPAYTESEISNSDKISRNIAYSQLSAK